MTTTPKFAIVTHEVSHALPSTEVMLAEVDEAGNLATCTLRRELDGEVTTREVVQLHKPGDATGKYSLWLAPELVRVVDSKPRDFDAASARARSI